MKSSVSSPECPTCQGIGFIRLFNFVESVVNSSVLILGGIDGASYQAECPTCRYEEYWMSRRGLTW